MCYAHGRGHTAVTDHLRLHNHTSSKLGERPRVFPEFSPTEKFSPTLRHDFLCFLNELVFVLNLQSAGKTVGEVNNEIVISALHNTGNR